MIQKIARVAGWMLLGLEILVLKPMSWLAQSVQSQPAMWSWPAPKNRHVALWVEGFRNWLAAASISLMVGLAGYTAMFWLGFITVVRWGFPKPTWSWGYPFAVVMTVAILVLAVWVWLLGLGTFLSLRIAYRTFGQLGSPLLRTFIHTPAAPPWEGSGGQDETVRGVLTTLRIAPEANLEALLNHAETAAADALAEIKGATFTPEARRD